MDARQEQFAYSGAIARGFKRKPCVQHANIVAREKRIVLVPVFDQLERVSDRGAKHCSDQGAYNALRPTDQ